MQSPYDLAIIKNAKAFFISEEFYDLYSIKDDKKTLISSVYDNLQLVRSLLLKFAPPSDEIIHELYAPRDNDNIFYIVEYNSRDRFLISFQIDEEDAEQLGSILKQIKSLESELADWFRSQLKRVQLQDSKTSTSIFPRYTIPKMIAMANQEEVKLASIELSNLIIETKNKDLDPTTINFKLGKQDYNLKVTTQSQKSIESDMHSFHLKIDFQDYQTLRSWLKFVYAMELRSKKLKKTN